MKFCFPFLTHHISRGVTTRIALYCFIDASIEDAYLMYIYTNPKIFELTILAEIRANDNFSSIISLTRKSGGVFYFITVYKYILVYVP